MLFIFSYSLSPFSQYYSRETNQTTNASPVKERAWLAVLWFTNWQANWLAKRMEDAHPPCPYRWQRDIFQVKRVNALHQACPSADSGAVGFRIQKAACKERHRGSNSTARFLMLPKPPLCTSMTTTTQSKGHNKSFWVHRACFHGSKGFMLVWHYHSRVECAV